jgi:hypothetical protein
MNQREEEYQVAVQAKVAGDAVSVPTPVIVGLVCFGFGVILGPALIASTQKGSEWLRDVASHKMTYKAGE